MVNPAVSNPTKNSPRTNGVGLGTSDCIMIVDSSFTSHTLLPKVLNCRSGVQCADPSPSARNKYHLKSVKDLVSFVDILD